MIKINKVNNSLTVEGVDNVFYPNNGDNSYPLNSLIVVIDDSDMATFRSVATNDVLFSGLINNITINGEAVTKDNIIAKFDAVSNSSTGGGTVDAYTKEEADAKFASKDELTNVQTVANDADTKVDALTPRVESVETSLGNKQDTLVSGENIKTINSQSILGSGDLTIGGVSEEQAQEIAKIPTLETSLGNKQDTLVSGTNIKTINNQSILGEGNLEVSGGIKTYEASEIPSVLLKELKEAVYNAISKKDYSKYTTTDVTPISQFLSNLSNGDYLKLYNSNEYKLQFIGNKILGTDFYYYFNIIVVGTGNTKIYSNYITVTVLSSQIYVGNNKSVEVAKITDIPSIDNFATKDELTAVETSLNNKQDTLVSGTNIKTINNQSILGEGNIEVSGVSDEQAQEIAKIPTLETEIAQKANVSDVPTVQNGLNGTNKNYVYSNADSSKDNDKVISSCEFINNAIDRLDFFVTYWGDGGPSKFTGVPLATHETAGIMSGNDKIKLDSIPENIQPTLVSGTNIKTINSQSILGEGNLEVTIPDATTATSGAMSAADKTKLDSLSNEWTGTQSEYDALTTKDDNIIYYVTE